MVSYAEAQGRMTVILNSDSVSINQKYDATLSGQNAEPSLAGIYPAASFNDVPSNQGNIAQLGLSYSKVIQYGVHD